MRVIAGEFRSRRLKSIPGDATRPTPDRLRETLFDILAPRIEGATFLDGYAGTGTVGIEALSRGAAHAFFLERQRAAIETIRENLAALREIVVPTPTGAQVPLGQLARIETVHAPMGIKSEAAVPNAWIYVDVKGIDIGAYVAAGSGNQLFRMARISPLRVYINVPQAVADLVKLGAEGDLSLKEFPGRTFPARETNTAVAINPISRALEVELQIPNESGELFPGAYAQVTLKLTGQTGLYTVPANALLFRAEGAAVGVVHSDGKVEIRKITITLDQGDTLQIAGGLSETDQVIVNPTDSLADGMRVNVLGPKQPASAQSPSSNG